jgi:hypothetical protein
MTQDWVKVKLAALVGIGSPWMLAWIENVGPVLDLLIKLGQAGVATVTICYIYRKWQKLKDSK